MKFYKRDPDRALAGMAELTLKQRGAYNSILDLLYSRDGDVPDDDVRVARMIGCNWREWKAVKGELIKAGKIWVEGGKIRAKRVQETIKDASDFAQEQSRRAAKGWVKRKTGNENNNPIPPPGNALTPTATPTPISRSVVSNDTTPLEAALREAAGWQNHPAPNLFVTGPIEAVIKAGADLHADVLPVIRAHAPRCRSPNWKFFISAIQRATADRMAAGVIPEGGNTNDRSRPGSISDAFAKFDAAFDRRLAEIDAGTGEGNSPADIIPLPRLREGNA